MRVVGVIVLGLVIIAGATGVVLYLRYGTVAPCSILRERVRQQATREGGQFGSFIATALPDQVIDGLIAAQYGPLSPGHCIGLLLRGEPQHLAPAAQQPGNR